MTAIKRKRRVNSKIVALVTFLAVSASGCQDAQEFRAATASAFESGLTTLVTGLIDGLVAVYEPDSTTDTTN